MIIKKTLLFSNAIGDVSIRHNTDIKFNSYMEEFLIKNILTDSRLLFIDAPGLGGEENYLENILGCFAKIGINFTEVLDLDINTSDDAVKDFISDDEKVIYFLMGGNPLTQMEIIKKFDLINPIKNHSGLVIGFCAGAINLSKYAIITSDEEFDQPQSYRGIERIPIIIEPHYNNSNDMTRNKEINDFAKKYNEEIYAIPDTSMIVVENDKVKEFGKIYHFS